MGLVGMSFIIQHAHINYSLARLNKSLLLVSEIWIRLRDQFGTAINKN